MQSAKFFSFLEQVRIAGAMKQLNLHSQTIYKLKQIFHDFYYHVFFFFPSTLF